MEAEVRTLCDKRRMRVRPGDMVLLAPPEAREGVITSGAIHPPEAREGVITSGGKAAWVSRQTNEARTILANLPPPPPGGAEVGVELGVVLMTKRPLELSTWLEYHHKGLGIRRFYIQVEDTPQLTSLLCAPPWDRLVVPCFVNGTSRDYFGQMQRQAAHITAVLPRARADGVTHLLHIDDDELLYCPSGVAALIAQLAAAPASCPDVHLCNLEALLPGDACASPFQEATVFSHYPTRYLSYTNGKSIGCLDEQSLRPQGPHHFRTERDKGGRGSPITYPLGPETACVLHYESGTYAQWQRKYLELAARHGTDPYYGTDPEVYARVPFAFYRASMLAAAAILTARATADGTPEAEAMVSVAESEALSAARQLWSEHKLAPKGLPPPSTEPRVLSEGLTILDPFVTVGLAPRPSPRRGESSQK